MITLPPPSGCCTSGTDWRSLTTMDSKMTKKPLARSKLGETHQRDLKTAVREVHQLLTSAILGGETVQSIYDKIFHGQSFPDYKKAKSKPCYSVLVYPKLTAEFFDPKIRSAAQSSICWDSAADLLALAAKESPLTRILAGYIWKRGELTRVKRVVEGIIDVSPPGDGAESVQATKTKAPTGAVMWQFGRHLADQSSNPICDQHAFRASIMLQDIGQLGAAFDIGLAKYNRRYSTLARTQVNEYVSWWKDALKGKLPVEKAERSDALYKLDMLLFSLGKAALVPSKSTDDDEDE
jgi:hypothetical protein